MPDWYKKVIQRTETVQWQVKVQRDGTAADLIVTVVNTAIAERQRDMHMRRNPGEVLIHTATIDGNETITVSYSRSVVIDAPGFVSYDEGDEDEPKF